MGGNLQQFFCVTFCATTAVIPAAAEVYYQCIQNCRVSDCLRPLLWAAIFSRVNGAETATVQFGDFSLLAAGVAHQIFFQTTEILWEFGVGLIR